jgi:hypothetical protein
MDKRNPPKTPIDCWAPATPPKFFAMGLDLQPDGAFITLACTRCLSFYSVPVGTEPRGCSSPRCLAHEGVVTRAREAEPTRPIRHKSQATTVR